LDCECSYAVRVERSAFHQDSRDTDLIENAFGESHTVALGQNDIDKTALVGNEEKRAAGGGAKFCAEGMVVGMRVSAEVTIGVSEFASETNGYAGHRLAGEKFEVSVVRHFLRFGQVGDQKPDFSERHIVQAVVVTELESAQNENRKKTKRGY